jgi:hypothetical protein
MESFFSRLKADIIDMVALCRTIDAALKLVDGYLKAYNGEHYQYELAGLTPEEFYSYAATGVYPLDNYFGVPAFEMMAVGDLSRVRRKYADEEARKRREAAAFKREQRRMIDPVKIIHRDQMLLDRMISKWRKVEQSAARQVEHLKGILEQTKKAMAYVANLSQDKLDELRDPLAWRKHEELCYVFAMNELF